jgi:hypothetical protein
MSTTYFNKESAATQRIAKLKALRDKEIELQAKRVKQMAALKMTAAKYMRRTNPAGTRCYQLRPI